MRLFFKLFALGSIAAALLALHMSEPTFNIESLKGARVLVTGASTGIGEQIAYHLAKAGAQIVITARRSNVLEQVVQKCMAMGAQKAAYIPADMSVASDPEKVVKFAEEHLGGLDYLVLNHIGPSPFAMWDGDAEHTRWLMQVNFLSYLQMAWKAIPTLEQSKGSIIVVSSLLGKMCTPFVGPYTATKFALNGFFGTMQHELAMKKSNVTVSICILGLIDTDSAMEKVRGYTNMTAYPASEAAWQIIKAGVTRQPEAFYPWYTYYTSLIKDWFPSYRNMVIQALYNYEP
ncbi:hydroxysteroid 11-beta-dehydrogenase 1-like protein [Clupea harengus]|uniref:Hydroxysteroid 11-beta-dehydrogenase 1-like protein n=1 Tax=Clupea harengus TaxID=7950 RepID=A0A6P3VNN4_CLUHA|nr:hydroxysteroid 11-beta-dehydrogenase 1-like protein [Clupea harengus]